MHGTSTYQATMVQSPYQKTGRTDMPSWPSVTVKQAAEMSGYNEEYLRRLVRDGKIEAEMLGYMYLIRLSSLEAYMAEMQSRDDARTGPKDKAE